jgi:acyl carrier protein
MRSTGEGFTGGGVEEAMEEAILRFVSAEVAAAPDGLTREERLVETGRVDSLGLLQILSFVEEHWQVNLLAAGSPKDLESVGAMAAAIRREQARRAEVTEAAS